MAGPFVSVATFCTEVRRGPSGQLAILEPADGATIPAGTSLPATLPINFVALIYAGTSRGQHVIGLELEDPSGARESLGERDVSFAETTAFSVIQEALPIRVTVEGLYVVAIVLDGKLAASAPLRLTRR